MKSLEEMCTLEKQGNLFILTLTGDDEHRLNPSLIDSIRAALKRVTAEATIGSALITTAQGKFFSNGYDLAWATDTVSDQTRLTLMDSKLKSLIFDLFNMPMPTIVAITGHASAAGFILALSHDYVLMRKDRGFLYMSEIDIGLNIPAWFVTLVKNKVKSPAAWREVVMRGTKLTADMAVEQGIVDTSHVGVADTVKAAVKLGEKLVARKWDGKVYAHTRRTVFADVLVELTTEIVSRL
ncbi:enoyl-CoA delta isomerase 1, peroxisomal-like [Lycium ferocissimum]|uniref:enoyl-CoA delta isomerase 1, peroxisomal-like n=1 Tax=Lycium ferocissimum TaxID=112874 RepID=UPI0028151198|nr:enoyl-CoA delta isomerase 1, peroxisomal-like [Lycium ferocissimum]